MPVFLHVSPFDYKQKSGGSPLFDENNKAVTYCLNSNMVWQAVQDELVKFGNIWWFLLGRRYFLITWLFFSAY